MITALVAMSVAHAAWWSACGPLDDDAILYRYGAHLARGDGFVFNPGERVEGFSSPLLVAFHALVEWARLDAVIASRALGWSASAATVLLVARTWQVLVPVDRVLWPAWIVAASPACAFHANAGLGTVLAAALVAAWLHDEALRAHARASGRVGAVALSLAPLVRPELALLAAVDVARRAGRRDWVGIPWIAAPSLAWIAFRRAYFGEWVPNTYVAKSLPLAEDLRRGASYLAGPDAWLFVAGLASALVLRARSRGVVENSLATGLAAVTAAVLFVGGDHMPFARLLVPALPLACVTIALLARRGIPQAGAAVACVLLALVLQIGQLARAERAASHDQLERRWRAVGAVLRGRVPPGALVATGAIGFLGYESGLPILDVLGLVDREIARTPPHVDEPMKGHTKHDARLVLDRRPHVILVGDGLLDEAGRVPSFAWHRGIHADPRFEIEYRRVVWPVPGSYPLVAWVRH